MSDKLGVPFLTPRDSWDRLQLRDSDQDKWNRMDGDAETGLKLFFSVKQDDTAHDHRDSSSDHTENVTGSSERRSSLKTSVSRMQILAAPCSQ